MTMRLTHFRVGVPDDIFSFDPRQYPDAVIVNSSVSDNKNPRP